MDKPGFRGRGLLGRFLYALPANLLGHRQIDAPPVPDDVRQTYHNVITKLLELPFGTDDEGHQTAHILRLDPEARTVLRHFEEWVEPQLAKFGELGDMTDWAGKLVGAVARLTGILHMAMHANAVAPWEVAIGAKTVERAISLGKYLLQHAQASYAEMGVDPVIVDAKYIRTWIDREEKKVFSKRDAYQGTKGRFKTVAAMEPALKLLVEHGFIRQRDPHQRPGPGRKPSPTYDVNPNISHDSHNSHNSHNRSSDLNSGNTENSGVIAGEKKEEVF